MPKQTGCVNIRINPASRIKKSAAQSEVEVKLQKLQSILPPLERGIPYFTAVAHIRRMLQLFTVFLFKFFAIPVASAVTSCSGFAPFPGAAGAQISGVLAGKTMFTGGELPAAFLANEVAAYFLGNRCSILADDSADLLEVGAVTKDFFNFNAFT